MPEASDSVVTGKTLIIAEKPSVGRAISQALGTGEKGDTFQNRKDGYIEGDRYTITWCIGHLVEPLEPEGYDERYKRWRYEDLPIIPGQMEDTLGVPLKKGTLVMSGVINNDEEPNDHEQFQANSVDGSSSASDTWIRREHPGPRIEPEQGVSRNRYGRNEGAGDGWRYRARPETKKQYDIVARLLNDRRFSEVVCATDAGREGETIFRKVYNLSGSRLPIKRLWISSMEDSAIREGFANLRPGEEYENLFQAGICREKADWLVGMNGTRLFTELYGTDDGDSFSKEHYKEESKEGFKEESRERPQSDSFKRDSQDKSNRPGRAGKHTVYHIGRVQTPTLAVVVEREESIRDFVKEPYYTVHILTEGLDAVSDKYKTREEAVALADLCMGHRCFVERITEEAKRKAAPKLYDLTSLQRDANRLFGFTALQTSEYTQSLYEKKLFPAVIFVLFYQVPCKWFKAA